LSFVFLPSALSQIPQGFNYQAIIRDGVTKQPIVSQPVMIRITIEDGIGTDLYQETHSLSTDEFGIISIIVGQGTPWGTSDFDEIDWNNEPLNLKTEVQYPVGGSYTLMGTAPLMSVPYAMVADSLGGPLKNLKVKADAATPDTEALFEVKNTTGQTVFAVYNEGVRIYVNDQDAKGAKGGFAIGGFGMGKTIPHQYMFISGDSVRFNIDNGDNDKGPKGGFAIGGFGTVKGLTQKYLMVSNDSVRIYVDNSDTDKGPKGGFAIGGYGTVKGNPQKLLTVSNDSVRIYINDAAKGPKGGFAIGGFDQAKGDGNNINFFNVSTSADDTINPSQNRILWYPLKNAFLTGKVLIEDKDSVGENSFASGYESKAVGQFSQALGYNAIARGDYSTSIGYQSVADKQNSFAFGQFANAKNEETYAFGRGAIAEGFRSYAFGSAGVDSAGAVTGVAYAKGNYSFAIGQGSQALGEGCFTLGLADTARGIFSLAMGYKTTAWGRSATAIGNSTRALESYSTAMGSYTTASEMFSTAMGCFTTASGGFSTAMGYYTKASGIYSTALGLGTNASGEGSIAMGEGSIASNYYSTAMGYHTNASGEYSTAIGAYTHSSGIYSFAFGRETTASGEMSTATGYETQAIGNYSTTMGSNTTASGEASTAMGYLSAASGGNSLAIGYNTTASGEASISMGQYTKAPSLAETVLGSYNTIYTPLNNYSWNTDDRLFVIANGTNSSARSNAMTVLKNGKIGLQSVTTPTYALELPNNSEIGIGQALAYDWATYSDGRVKSEQKALAYGLGEILQLIPSEYFHNNTLIGSNGIEIGNTGKHDIGLIAQDVYNIIPEAVSKPENEETELWSISYDKLIPIIINAIKEQQVQIEEMKRIISRMEERIASSSR